MTAWTSSTQEESGMFSMIPTQEENDTVSTLLAMIGGTEAQKGKVLEVYRRNGGNADKAAEALLSGGLESSSNWVDDAGSSSTSMALVPINKTPSARHNTPEDSPDLVDLTKDDSLMAVDDEDLEMKKALEMSLEYMRTKPEDENREEIAMDDNEGEMEVEVEDLEGLLRKDGRPISLRAPTPDTTYAALLLQALFHVPQVRARLATVPIPDEPPLSDNNDLTILFRIIELFGNLDLANLARLECDAVCKALDVWPMTAAVGITESTKNLYERLGGIFEAAVASQTGCPPLLTFTSAQVDILPGQSDEPKTTQVSNHTYVALDLSSSTSGTPGEPLGNDLLTRLTRDLFKPIPDIQGGPSGSSNTVISTPSEVVAFILTSSNSNSSVSLSTPVSFAVPLHNTSSSRFSYPSALHIDPFLSFNLPLVHSKRVEKERLTKEVGEYEDIRGNLIGKKPPSTSSISVSALDPESSDNNSQDQGVLPSLRAALYYYEHVANRCGVEGGMEVGGRGRKETVEEAERSLRATLGGMEKALQDLDTKITEAKTRMRSLFEGEELRKYQYDLRSVLMQPASSSTSTSPHPSFSQLHTLTQAPTSKQARSKFSKQEPFVYVRDIRDDLNVPSLDGNEKNSKPKPRWWKLPAQSNASGIYVEEVSEEVVLSTITTPSASAESVPYMLIYSKSLSSTTSASTSSLQWPSPVVASVELNNARFLEVVEAYRASKQQEPDRERGREST